MRTQAHSSALIVVAFVLLVQYGAVGMFDGRGEPWPALTMPAFQTTWATDEDVVLDRVHFMLRTAEGQHVPVPIYDLFDALPATHHPALARAHFACDGTLPDSELVAWTRNRLQTLYPRESPSRLDVTWESVAVPIAQGMRHARTTPGRSCAFTF